jgi:hypothetical protein
VPKSPVQTQAFSGLLPDFERLNFAMPPEFGKSKTAARIGNAQNNLLPGVIRSGGLGAGARRPRDILDQINTCQPGEKA